MTNNQRFTHLKIIFYLLILPFVASWLALMPATAHAQDKSGVKPQVISLPSGPGSLEGLGETFEPNLSTGTSSYPVKFTAAPGRVGFQPEISLGYDGGNANGPWGMGWKLSVPSIQRRTEDGLPSYDDAQDTFIFSNGEKLVRLSNGDYRFENESSFMRFRRIAGGGWEAHTPDGLRYLFGESENARVDNHRGIFRWELERMVDTHGNELKYSYLHDGEYAYPREIRYNFGANTGGGAVYNTVVFNYEPRPDTYTDRRSGAPIRVGLRGTDIQMWALGKLVRAYQFSYEPERSTGKYSLLNQVRQVGDDGVSTLPPHSFTYTQFDATTSAVVPMQNIPPVALTNPDADLVDINADGLPDLVYTPADGQHRFYLNRGHGRWQVEPVLPQNSPAERLSNPNVRMADVNGDGAVDLMVKAGTTADAPFYYYRNQGGREWQQGDRVDFGPPPAFDLNDPTVQLFDVDNDKRIDVVWSVSERLKIWLAREGSWSQTADFDVPAPAAGEAASFADPKVKLFDMNGDRMLDLVLVRDGQVVVWAHNGNGDYDQAETILNPPTGVGAEESTIQVDDLNNDGLGDLVLVGNRRVTYWLNLGDGSLSDPIVIENTPAYNAQETAVRLADIDGDGASELVFSSAAGMEYVDFSTREQPFLLRSVDNGLGRTIHITYKSSIEDYIADWDANNPWEINLPFPTQVVNQVTVHDANSGDDYTIDYHYRDGFYDGVQKEFRGFVRSQEIKRGDATTATTVTNLVYDVGMSDESRKGMLLESEVLAEGGRCTGDFAGCFQRTVNQLTTRTVVEAGQTTTGKAIAYAFVSQTDSFVHEQTATPVQLRQTFAQDDFGNQTQAFNFGKVCNGDVTCGDDEILTYTDYIYDQERYLFNRPMRIRQTDAQGNFVSETRMYYDGEPYIGLPAGQLTRGDLTRKEENLGPNDNNRFIPTKRQKFDESGNMVGIMDGNGHITTVAYDPVQQTFPVLERIHFENGRSLSYAATYHMGFGKITGATDYNGHAHAFAYDTFGRITKIVSPGDTLDKPTQQFRYAIGSPHSAIYSDLRIRSGEDAVIEVVVYYDGLGRQLQKRTVAENGNVVVSEAVAFNARQSVRDEYLPYFDTGLAYRAPDPVLPKATVQYDAMARTLRTVNPDGTYSSVIYRPLAQLHFDEEDNTPNSPHANTPTTFVFDGMERLLSTEETNIVNGQVERYVTRYDYDRLGNLIRLTDAQGNVKTMTYDALGRKLHMLDPDKGEMHYTYDDAGNLLVTRDALGQVIQRTYDAAHRLLMERWVYNDGRAAVTNAVYHYDSDRSPPGNPLGADAQNTLGQVAYIEDQAGTVHFSYDPRGNVIGSVRRFHAENLALVTLLQYDAMNRLTQATFPDSSTVDYRYNARGLLQSIPGIVNQIDYNASAMRESIRYANGVRTSYDYDARLRLQQLKTTSDSAGVLQDLRYTFDQVSNVLSISDGRANRVSENDQTQSFVYDALNRMTQAAGTYGQIDFGYDAIGNMVRKVSSAPDVRLNLGEMRYGENGAGPHALTSANDETWSYDANGNLRQRGLTHYHWDARNQLTSLHDTTMHSSYVYDVEGQRVKQMVQTGDDITTTLYAGQYAEVRGDELILYIFDEQHRVAQVTKPLDRNQLLSGFGEDNNSQFTGALWAHNSQFPVHWYVADHLGGTSLLLDASGNVVSEIAYYPFGLTRYEANGDNVYYRFTGHEQDASGLQYFNARYYEPVTGRFLSVDPLYVETPISGFKNPQLLNLYAYALNNPGRYTDPDGTEPEDRQSMRELRIQAGKNLENRQQYGYDPEGLLKNPRLSPTMVFQADIALSNFIQQHGDQYQVRVTQGYAANDPDPNYKLGLAIQVKIYDKEGRFVHPKGGFREDDPYMMLTAVTHEKGFQATTYLPSSIHQGHALLVQDPNGFLPGIDPHIDGVNRADALINEILTRPNVYHMQDIRKQIWKAAHGSYWRQRYAYWHPIMPSKNKR
jgi:RHS repeat-associated protein